MSDGLSCYGSGGGGGVRRLFRYVPGQAGYTFTNASANGVPTYVDVNGVVRSVNTNVLRDSHYIGGVRTTLLEGARTNLATQSEHLDNAAWTKNRTTISADSTTAPDGNTTADLILETAVSNTFTVFQQLTVSLNAVCTTSVFMKAQNRTWGYITEGNGVTATAYFDLTNGVVGNVTGTGSPTGRIQALGNGWYRCSMSFTAVGTTPNLQFGPASANGTNNYAGNTSNGIYAWGGMLEQVSAFPSSYIADTSSAITRAFDNGPTMPEAFAEQAITLYSKYVDLGTQLSGSAGVFAVGDNKTKPALYIAASSTTVMKANFHNGSALVSSSGVTTSIAYGDTIEARLVLTASGTVQLGISRNGGAETTDTASAGQALGSGFGGSNILLNTYDTTDGSKTGFMGGQKFLVAAGAQSLAVCRSL